MLNEIREIKTIRKNLGLTQSELARKADLSQSLITKIEAGTLDPTYSKAAKIFDVLNNLSKSKELKAKDFINKRLMSIDPSKDIKEVIKFMRKHGISQIPVIKNDKCVGLISETILLDAFTRENVKTADDIMGECPPIISNDTSIKVISSLLRFYPIVIVSEKGKLLGIITKSDLLRAI